MDTVIINEKDNVCVNLETGHKIALADIPEGTDIIKYGFPIGISTCNISKGDAVHSHNMKTKLGDLLSYEYTPVFEEIKSEAPFEIEAFVKNTDENFTVQYSIFNEDDEEQALATTKKENEEKEKEAERKAQEKQKEKEAKEREKRIKNNPIVKIAKSSIHSVGREYGKKLIRGLLGTILK